MTTKNIRETSIYVLGFEELDKSALPLVGGKGANLGELFRIEGLNVPDGFCITTEAYKILVQSIPGFNDLLDELSGLEVGDREGISRVSARVRAVIEAAPFTDDLIREVTGSLIKFDKNAAFAVRSSATAEDLPSASFAGQQDTYLNIIGNDAVLRHISKCWASLFTERAVTYRIKNGFGHSKIQLAVVVQQMIFPQAAGIVFTADPVSGNRKILSIDAGFGLGEALVAGLVNADNYKVRGGEVIHKKISAKKLAIYALSDGGTQEQEIGHEIQGRQTLTDEQILQLESIGRKIEKHFGRPQDIEWCLAGDVFYVVQSRPVTTLFPVPDAANDEPHVYVSVGHQQMMTDAMRPLGISLWQLTAFRPMFKAGGRLFVDVAKQLIHPASRTVLLNAMGQHDPLIHSALTAVIERGDILKLPAGDGAAGAAATNAGKTAAEILSKIENSPAIAAELIRDSEASVAALKRNIQALAGPQLFDFILNDLQQMRKDLMAPQNMAAIMAGIDASAWLNDTMNNLLGEVNVADVLSRSVANNITSEMGLELTEVADMIRPYPELITYLQQVKGDNFLKGLIKFPGGQQANDAIDAYLSKYGMRCAGEIDITKTRWSENPSALIPAILGNVKNLGPGAGKQKFEQGLQEALDKEQELLARLVQLPGGGQKAEEAKEMIRLLRNFIGYREYPKYSIVNRLFVYKQALLKEAEMLLKTGVIADIEDIYYLTFEELKKVISINKVDMELINDRKEEHRVFEKLTPPRVITSDGEIITGSYERKNLPVNAIVGLAVSSGQVEGRALVILKMEDADLQDGDILITRFTDPSWTPLFVSIKGLVTEVGGLMTHGAVIAREYGLPAVVGVEDATTLIKEGQQIRLNGTDGYIEIR